MAERCGGLEVRFLPSSFGIGPADHDNSSRFEAFDLEPLAGVAGRVRRIGALRVDPLEGMNGAFPRTS
jgi:hypothetical protein